MRVVLACFIVLGALSACGTDAGEPAAAGQWTEQRIAASPGADSPIGFAADGDDVLVVVVDEEGILQSALSTDAGEFRPGERFDTQDGAHPGFADPVRLDGVWWLMGSGGRVGKGNDEQLPFEPRVLRSADGLTWESVDVSGIPSPVDINAVAAVDGALVAVGSKRNGVDSGGASFEAAVWRSEDGATWTEAALPGVVPQPTYREESYAGQVGLSGDRLLVGGSLAQRAAVWSSTLPEGSLPEEPERVELVTVPEGADPEPGVRYHAPLYLHCGMEWLYLGDQPWQRTDRGPDVETGAGDSAPDWWPVSGQMLFGYATLGPDGVVSYTDAEGRLIATYERTGARPPGCD